MKEGFYGVGGVECRILWSPEGSRAPVLFLHGFSFTGSTWREIGVLDYLSERGNSWAAPDMPYGRRTDCTKHTRDIEFNVEAAREVVRRYLDGREPVVVGASLGGRVAVAYGSRYPVKGLLLLAPAIRPGTEEWKAARKIEAPTLIVAGTRDRIVPLNVLRTLASEMGAKLIVYEDAGHAMYLESPERFMEDLDGFLTMIEEDLAST